MDLMKKMKLKPAKSGAKIPNPKTGFFLKEDGEVCDMTKYWRRLFKSGQVVEAKKEVKKPTKKMVENKQEDNTEKGE